jgi:hypothetical protein
MRPRVALDQALYETSPHTAAGAGLLRAFLCGATAAAAAAMESWELLSVVSTATAASLHFLTLTEPKGCGCSCYPAHR